MKSSLRFTLIVLALTALAQAAPNVRVEGSRKLQLAVVDFARPSEARAIVHAALASSLEAAMSERFGRPVGVAARGASVDHAAFNLNAGVFDAVLVLGKAVPAPLKRSDGITLSAVPQSGKRDTMVFLVIAEGDAEVQGLLAAAFTRAMADARFLAAFGGAEARPLTEVGVKTASNSL